MTKRVERPLVGASHDTEAALVAALVPICGAMLRHAYGAGDLIALIKRAYLKAAIDQGLPHRRLNISRLAVTTGMTRKEVAALLGELSNPTKARVSRSEQRAMRVIRGWQSDSRFLLGTGRPKRLPLRGEGATFESVVADYAGDVTTVSVLRELMNLGAVAVDADERVSLDEGFTTTLLSRERSLIAMSEALAGVGEALTADNAQCAGSVSTRNFRLKSSVDAVLLHQIIARRASAMLNGMEQWVKSRRSRQRPPGSVGASTRIGIYAITKPDQTPSKPSRKR